jgi:coenzyme F420 biosynthesis associated uncharacterized protein
MSDSWIDWNAAARSAKRVSRSGPKASAAQIRQAVAELHWCAERAIELVAKESRLPVASHAHVLAVDRPSIIDANIQNCRHLFAASGVEEMLAGTTGGFSSKVSGAAVGVGLAAITTRILGQFIPFGERPTLYLAVPNIMKCERQIAVDPIQFRLWVCLHEQTHQAQFSHAAWLSDYLIGVLAKAVAAEVDEVESVSGAWERLLSMVHKRDGKTTVDLLLEQAPPEVAAALGQVTAVMSLLEGHADVMMDAVGPSVIPDLENIRAKFDERRGKGGWSAAVGKMMGMDAKLAQYKDGAMFCRAVIAARSIDVLNLAFADADNLPTLDELRDPDAWIARVASTPELASRESLWVLPPTPTQLMPPVDLPPLSDGARALNREL